MYEFYYHKLQPYYNNTQRTRKEIRLQSAFGASGKVKLKLYGYRLIHSKYQNQRPFKRLGIF